MGGSHLTTTNNDDNAQLVRFRTVNYLLQLISKPRVVSLQDKEQGARRARDKCVRTCKVRVGDKSKIEESDERESLEMS